jgi:hypothetical protein
VNAEDERFLGLILIIYPLAFGIAGLLVIELLKRVVRSVRKDKEFWA